LIQAQFDAAFRDAECQSSPNSGEPPDASTTPNDELFEDRPPKRRKLSFDNAQHIDDEKPLADSIHVRLCDDDGNELSFTSSTSESSQNEPAGAESKNDNEDPAQNSTELVKLKDASSAQPLPPHAQTTATPGSGASIGVLHRRNLRVRTLADSWVPLSSSPLSSPPPVLFDPYEDTSSNMLSRQNSSLGSSTSQSEVDDTPPSSQPLGSQSSNSSRTSLPNMKGKDLFDAQIWSDPLRTSVFYTFATTLRQKVRDVQPTPSHYFISHLRDRGKLVRCYTQNIDRIEEKVGLCTALQQGPGSRGRFSRKSLNDFRKDSLATKQEPAKAHDNNNNSDKKRRESAPGGVECVYLHGSLESLRCFRCGNICTWNEEGREQQTMSGHQPECPHCAGATAAREEKGKRALGVGKLRPDIVLYGEEHPSSHLISPLVTHDLALGPDVLLILGTSLRVHGLKVMVREFAKAVHNKGGKVVFVNFTKPPESSWGDIIDYWIQWDCDTWVTNLKERIPIFWMPPGTVLPSEPKKKKEPTEKKKAEKTEKVEKPLKAEKPLKPPKPEVVKVNRPPAVRPAATRDHRANGAYLTWKIHKELLRITGDGVSASGAKVQISKIAKARKPRAKKLRHSAPAALDRPVTAAGTVEVMETTTVPLPETSNVVVKLETPTAGENEKGDNSILTAVKSNPRARKRKTIDGVEISLPVVASRTPSSTPRSADKPPRRPKVNTDNKEKKRIPKPKAISRLQRDTLSALTLPPLKTISANSGRLSNGPPSPFPKPEPLEPLSSPRGPLTNISSNIHRSAMSVRMSHPFFLFDPLASHVLKPPKLAKEWGPDQQLIKETEAAMALSGLKGSMS
jgi:hercynylcysteine S-oxide lyase